MSATVVITGLDGRECFVGRGMNRRWFEEYDRIAQSVFPTTLRGEPLWRRKSRRQHRRSLKQRYSRLSAKLSRKLEPHRTFYSKEAFLRAHLPIWQDPDGPGYSPSPAELNAPFRHIKVWW